MTTARAAARLRCLALPAWLLLLSCSANAPVEPSTAAIDPAPGAKQSASTNAPSTSAPSASAIAGDPALRLELADNVSKVSGRILAAVPAEIALGDVRMAVTWRAFRQDGRFVDNDIVGLRFRREAGGWRFIETGGGRQMSGAPDVTELMGGEGWKVIRTCGVSLTDIPTMIPRLASAFDDAFQAKGSDLALATYLAFTTAFSFEEVAYTHHLPNYLMKRVFIGSRWTCDEARGACVVETVATPYDDVDRDGTVRTRTNKGGKAELPLEPCGDGWVLGAPRRAQ